MRCFGDEPPDPRDRTKATTHGEARAKSPEERWLGSASHDEWLSRPECIPAPAASAVRFAYAELGKQLVGTLGGTLGLTELALRLGLRLGLGSGSRVEREGSELESRLGDANAARFLLISRAVDGKWSLEAELVSPTLSSLLDACTAKLPDEARVVAVADSSK